MSLSWWSAAAVTSFQDESLWLCLIPKDQLWPQLTRGSHYPKPSVWWRARRRCAVCTLSSGQNTHTHTHFTLNVLLKLFHSISRCEGGSPAIDWWEMLYIEAGEVKISWLSPHDLGQTFIIVLGCFVSLFAPDLHLFGCRNKETNRDEFIFYSKRLMRLLIEHALSFLPLKVREQLLLFWFKENSDIFQPVPTPFFGPLGWNCTFFEELQFYVNKMVFNCPSRLCLQSVSVETPQGGVYNGKRLSGKRVSLCLSSCSPEEKTSVSLFW